MPDALRVRKLTLMLYVSLLLVTLLAACTSAPHLPLPRPSTIETPASAGHQSNAPGAFSPALASALVYGKKTTGRRDFANAKKVLPSVFAGMEEDFYCGCRYTGNTVNFGSCGYQPRKNAARASRIEWEHVVPAWSLGHQRKCWQDGGRKNCTQTDNAFKTAEGDLVNLVPAVGEVNGDRSNFPYAVWTSRPTPMYGACQTVIDFKGKRAQPRAEVRGRAARISLYMQQTYNLRVSKQDKQLMCAWAKAYPVDRWERRRDTQIVRLQGKGNTLVSSPASLKRICG